MLAASDDAGQQEEVVSRSTVVISPEAEAQQGVTAFDLRKSSRPREKAYATESFWTDLAQCETANNWDNGGRYAGGLGIMNNSRFPKASMGTWERFGGEEFAPSPDKATKEQQIIVANRISVEGYRTLVKRDPDWARRQGVPAEYIWDQRPVGFTGWGCYKSKSTGKYRMSKPKLYYYENFEDVILFSFKFNETSKAVHDLQTFLGVTVDSNYGKKTKAAHLSYLKKKRLPLDGVPGVKPSVVGIAFDSPSHFSEKSCPNWEPALLKAGLPVSEFSYIMWRESRCKPAVIGWNYREGMSSKYCNKAPAEKYKRCKAVSTYDSGLLQINSTWVTVTQRVCGTRRGDMSALLSPGCNLAVAKYLYDNGGYEHWSATS